MELYHRTLLQPNTHSLALAVHLDAIKPKQEYDKPRQLLLCQTNSLQLFRAIPSKIGSTKYELKMFHHQQLFSSVCAAEIIVYQDQDLRQDIVIVTLSNGKYQLLQWRVQKFALTDQKLVFGNEQSVESGLCKPKIGHYVAVNNDARLVLIAAVDWECKLYTRTFSMHGMILTQVAHLMSPYQIDRPSICLQISPSYGPSCFFYSLRSELKEGQKQVKVYKIRRGQDDYEEEGIIMEDNTVKMVVGRNGDNFFVVSQKYVYYSVKGKMAQLKVPQSRSSLQVSCWKRPLRQKKEEYFLLNDYGQLLILNFDDTNANLCTINYIELLVPSLQGVAIQKNLFFLLTGSNQNLLLEAVGKYKCEDRIQKTRASKQIKEEREELGGSGKGQFKEFQVVALMDEGRIIRDLKICNIEKGMSNQILVTGGRPGRKRGFLSVMKHGLKMKIHISINLASAQGIWPIRRHASDKHHAYVVISFINRRTTTYIHDCGRLTPTNDLRLDETENTLHVVRFGDNSLLQVSPSKLKYINKEGVSKMIQIKGRISKATSVSEGKQLLLMLLGGYIEYYEVCGGELLSMKEFALQSQVNNVEFGPTELVDGKPYSKMLVIGLSNYHVNVYAIGLPSVLTLVASRNIKNGIQSLAFVSQNEQQICVYIGTNNGKGFKWLLHKNGEQIQHPQQHIYGEKGIKFSKLSVGGKPSIFRLTPQPYLSYNWQGQPQECSIPLPSLQQIAQVSLQGIEGSMFITYYGGYLRFIQIYGFGNLLYTNDKQLQFPGKRLLILQDRLGILTEGKVRVDEKQIWVSKFFILNPAKQYSMEKNIAFDANEKVLSMSSLGTKDGKNLLCFGCCIGHTNFPPNSVSLTSRFPSIKIYSYEKQNEELLVNFLFAYPLDNPPTAMQSYFSQLLVGVGRKLMLYDIYKQKLVVRGISDMLSSPVCTIHVDEEKIFVTQVYQSFSLMKYNSKNKCFDIIGQDFIDRFTTSACLMDGEAGVMAGGDKFGNFYVSKMSEKMKVEFQEIKETTFESSTNTHVMESLAGYHIGEVITAVQNGKIDPKKPDCIFYATIDGRIGMFYPLEGEEQGELIQLKKLQSELSRSSFSGATNHRNFRSCFNPAKGVVDGDFCHLFDSLSEPQRSRLTNSLQKDTKEINSLLNYMQNKFS